MSFSTSSERSINFDNYTVVHQVTVQFYPFAFNDEQHLIGCYENQALAEKVFLSVSKFFKGREDVRCYRSPLLTEIVETPAGWHTKTDSGERATMIETVLDQDKITDLLKAIDKKTVKFPRDQIIRPKNIFEGIVFDCSDSNLLND